MKVVDRVRGLGFRRGDLNPLTPAPLRFARLIGRSADEARSPTGRGVLRQRSHDRRGPAGETRT